MALLKAKPSIDLGHIGNGAMHGAEQVVIALAGLVGRQLRDPVRQRQTRLRCLNAASAPEAVHSTSRSGGLSDMTNQRAVSAPKEAMIFIGSTTFFFDFDILAEGMISTAVPSASFPSVTSSGR
jgi:hypothetical protein